MATYLPSTGALQSFVATARHLSFTRAAIELNVTQTAISHRLRQLEDLLNVKLFVRDPEGIRLTDDGRRYLEQIRPALSEISVATDRIAHRARSSRLRLLGLSAFLTRSLMPSLREFQAAHQEIEFRLTAINNGETMGQHDFDVAVLYGAGEWPGFESHRLGRSEIFPVCSPATLEYAPLKTLEDLQRHTIIRVFSPLIIDDWPAWLRHAGVGKMKLGPELRCDGSLLAIEAAINGLGVLIARSEMVERDVAAGRLVAPLDIRQHSSSSYYMLIPEERTHLPAIVAFRSWMLKHFVESAL